MTPNEKILIYYLASLLDKGAKENVTVLKEKVQRKELMQYLLEKYPNSQMNQLGQFPKLVDSMVDYAWDDGKYLLDEYENGLALLLCLIVNNAKECLE